MTQTLLSSHPGDVNRRTIVDTWNDFTPVWVFNQEMSEWTAEREQVLELVLGALNSSKEVDGGS